MDARALRIQSSRSASSRQCPQARHPAVHGPSQRSACRKLRSCAQHRHRKCSVAVWALSSDSEGESSGGDSSGSQLPLTYSSKDNDNQTMLMKYVTEVEPSVVDTFGRTGPPQVVDAFNVTVVGLVGTLPPAFFEVNIVTLGDNLRSLMYSFLMTGYLYRHVVDKLEMKKGLDRALPGSVLQDDLDQDARPGMRMGLRSQDLSGFAQGADTSDVVGSVKRWNYQTGVDEMGAAAYIKMLEKEVQVLREQFQEDEGDEETNDLLVYMRDSPPSSVQSVRAGPEVSAAMDAFLRRLLGSDDQRELSSVVSETSQQELHRLLTWLLIVGYTLRSMEIRFSMEQSYTLPYVALEDQGLRDSM